MDSTAWDKDRIAALLRALVRRGAFDEILGNALADEIEADARSEELSPRLKERLREAVERGMLDGQVARGRARMHGTLGGFGTALRRIREAAGVSLVQMAERAGLTPELWERLESHRGPLAALDVATLASVVEATQLRLAEVADTLRRSGRLHLVSPGHTSFRADEDAGSDSMAAYEDLLGAIAHGEREQHDDGPTNRGIEDLIEGLRAELHRRGREDLL